MTTGTGPPSAIEAVNPRYGLKTGAGLLHADYHVVSWATAALDEVRREVWNHARREAGDKALADQLKGCRYALWKNPENLTGLS